MGGSAGIACNIYNSLGSINGTGFLKINLLNREESEAKLGLRPRSVLCPLE